MSNHLSLPFDKMVNFNKRFPESKAVYRQMQQLQLSEAGKFNSNHPIGVFCPSSKIWGMSDILANYALLQMSLSKDSQQTLEYSTMHEHDRNIINYYWGLFVFGAWRNTLSVYEIDYELANNIIEAPIPDDTPISIFNNLPEWCVYIAMPSEINLNVVNAENKHSTRLHGFWALIDYSSTSKTKVLSLVMNLDAHIGLGYETLQPMFIPIKKDLSIADACFESFNKISNQVGRDFKLNENLEDYRIIKMMLSFLLMLCAEEPDVSSAKEVLISREQLKQPKHSINKKTGVFITPSAVTTYKIGERFGAESHHANKKLKDTQNEDKNSIITRKRPHIRRGHWRLVWLGSAGNKQPKIYWQPPIFVNSKI